MNYRIKEIMAEEFVSMGRDLLEFMRQCGPEEEASIEEQQWVKILLNGAMDEKRTLLQLEIVRRHVDAKDRRGRTVLQKYLGSRTAMDDEELAGMVQALYEAGARVSDTMVGEAVRQGNDGALRWLNSRDIDITQGGREVNLLLYKEATYGEGRDPSWEIVRAMESRILQRNLRKAGERLKSKETRVPVKKFI